jgi:hypothetical protein
VIRIRHSHHTCFSFDYSFVRKDLPIHYRNANQLTFKGLERAMGVEPATSSLGITPQLTQGLHQGLRPSNTSLTAAVFRAQVALP